MSAILISQNDPGITVTSAAGNSKTITNNKYQNLQLISVVVTYTTSATAGNRQLVLQVSDSGGNAYMRVLPATTQAASLTYYYCFAVGITTNTSPAANSVGVSMPPIVLPIGSVIGIYDNQGLDAADSFTTRIAAVY